MTGTDQVSINTRSVSFTITVLFLAALAAVLANSVSMGIAVAAVLAIVIFAVSFISSEFALYVLIFSMLLGPQFITESSTIAAARGRGITLRFDDFLIAIIGLSWFLRTAIDKELGLFLRTALNKPIAFYFLACALATLNGCMWGRVKGITGFFFVFKYVEYFIIYFMAVNHLKKREQIERFLVLILLVCLLVCLYGIFQIPSGVRVSAPFEGEEGEPNTLGGYLVLMVSVVIGLLVTKGAFRHKKSLLVLLALMFIVLGATHSRGSWIALPPLFLTLIYFSRNRRLIVLPLIAVLLVSPFVFPQSVVDRVAYTFTQPNDPEQLKIGQVRIDTSTSARLLSWRTILTQDFLKHPILGYGITGYGFVDAQYPRMLAETGLVGLVSFFFLLWSVWNHVLRIYRTTNDPLAQGLALGYLGGFVGLLFHGIGANTFIIVRIMEPFWFLTALVVMSTVIETKRSCADCNGPSPAAVPETPEPRRRSAALT
ncbi:MAG TPA: O-antigen ligase family protein [Syntrophales bacterium]|jgi:O-antigen ligase|nr:O-antigen ligase family protein [Syntrophales bacterium]HQN17484.1 O-antigen ligase family protein [Syntrophobacteraceae bacterium]